MNPPKYTREYEDWFAALDEEAKILVNSRIIILQGFGSNLGRPFVDTIKGAKY